MHGRTYRYVPLDPNTRRNLPPVALGRDRADALKRWAELTSQPSLGPITCADLWARYEAEEIPRKALATQTSYRRGRRRGRHRPTGTFQPGRYCPPLPAQTTGYGAVALKSYSQFGNMIGLFTT